MAKKVSKFESLDGKCFDSNKDAEVHDSGIVFMQAFMEELGYQNRDGSLKNMCVDFAKKFAKSDKLQKAVANIRRAHSLKS